MNAAALVDPEKGRLEMLRSLRIVDTGENASLQDVTDLAADLSGSSISLITLLTEDRQWFAAKVGIEGDETPRDISFCTHAIQTPTEVMWIEDARADVRFAQNPLVLGPPSIRFYAGAPLVVNGYALGTLCIIDTAPRPRDDRVAGRLQRLAQIVAAALAERHKLNSVQGSLEASADALIDCDEHGVITSWSAGAERLFGFSAQEAVGQPTTIIVPARDHEAHAQGIERWRYGDTAALGSRLELTAARKAGDHFDVELWMSVWHDQGSRRIHANVRDITERNRQRASIEEARVKAEAASLSKTQFLANMSHELRTPLNGVIGVADLLRSTRLSSKQAEYLSIIQGSAGQLNVLIADLLDVARIEAGEISINLSDFDLETEARSAFLACSVQAADKHLEFTINWTSSIAGLVRGDSARLKQVLTNLLSNAIKFTDQGLVELAVSYDNGVARFEVRDQGIGFTEEQRLYIFERFQQADNTITRRFGGTGLGLSIARDLVHVMGGQIDCASTPGVGSRFWFSLPLQPIQPQAPSTSHDTMADAEPLRILLVDDNATNRRVAELMLDTLGAASTPAEDGRIAVEKFRQGNFDVVLMDMMMPVMDGLDATRAIRKIELERERPRTPIIMLTANTLPEHIKASLEAGADSHLAKPITASGLFTAIGEVLG